MRETTDYLRRYLIEAKDVARLQWRSFACGLILFGCFYVGSLTIEPGVVTYLLAFPAALIIALTSLARVNDIGVEHMGPVWHVRRVSLTLAGAGAVMVMASPFTGFGPVTWRGVVLLWGVAGAFLTTPHTEPWWPYITGEYRKRAPPRSPLDRIVGRITGAHRTDALKAAEEARRRGEGGGNP